MNICKNRVMSNQRKFKLVCRQYLFVLVCFLLILFPLGSLTFAEEVQMPDETEDSNVIMEEHSEEPSSIENFDNFEAENDDLYLEMTEDSDS